MARITTVEEALAEVRESGEALKYVPENLKTEELCLEAVKQNGNMLCCVPENLKTAEICLAAVKQCRIEGNIRVLSNALQYVPENLKTAELCLEAVKQSGSYLQYVPENLKTTEICLEAVRQYGSYLQYIPENLRTAEICLAAVRQDGKALQYVPKKLRTAEINHEAVMRGCKQIKSLNYSIQHPINHHLSGMETAKHSGEIDHIFYVFKEMSEDLRDEMRIRLINEGERAPSVNKDAAAINIRALTQEGICFEFDKLSERESDFVTDKIKVFVIIPDHREVPKSITLKFTNTGKTAEQREAVINCDGRFTKAGLEGIVILHASAGKPRTGYKYRQKAEITLNFENRSEPLTCPISGTTTFGMCFYDAYETQKGKPKSVGTICEFSDNE
jgi:hypothetical protein